MNAKFWGLTIFGIFILSASGVSAAQDCDFKKDILDLQVLKTADPAELVEEKELELRKTALNSILGCLINSTENIYKNIESLPHNQQGNNLRLRFSQELKGNIFFYKEKQKEIETADLKSSKIMAKEILSWKKNHTEDLERAAQFVIWGQNQNFLQTASKRLAQISGLFGKRPGNKAFEAARSLVEQAERTNSLAQESLERSVPTSESLGYIRNSLEAMHGAYKNFLKLGGQ